MSSSQEHVSIQPIDRCKINTIEFADIRSAFREGMRDFRRKPLLSMVFGLICALFGLFIVFGLFKFGQIWMIVPAGVGFPLVAPFLASGLYEMSRRYQLEQEFSWGEIFTVVFSQQRRELGWMAFVMLFVFWIWVYQVRLLLALFLQWSSFSSFDGFLLVITTTSNGFLFLGVGTIVGAFLATILFTLTIVAMPLLLDQEIDFVSAMLLSIKSTIENRFVLLGWGLIIAVMIFLAILPAFLGVIVVLPILGHTTWHVYKRIISVTPLP